MNIRGGLLNRRIVSKSIDKIYFMICDFPVISYKKGVFSKTPFLFCFKNVYDELDRVVQIKYNSTVISSQRKRMHTRRVHSVLLNLLKITLMETAVGRIFLPITTEPISPMMKSEIRQIGREI